MKITLIGHATLLVELEGAVCLTDPVLCDPFEEGAVVSTPRRAVHLDKLPAPDAVIVSHRHPDHFDIPSLLRLPKTARAYCPEDKLIVYALETLGFAEVTPLPPMRGVSFGNASFYPTASENPSVPEFGMVFADPSGIFWNQVDTPLSDATIAAVKKRFGNIDVMSAMYASQNFEFFENRTTEFPFDTHKENLDTVLKVAPKAVFPGSAGFRFADAHDWINRFLFPISSERFLADLGRLAPKIEGLALNPGDEIILEGGALTCRPGASPAVTMEEDDTHHLRFDPTAAVPELTDPNPDGEAGADLLAAMDHHVGRDLRAFAESGYGRGDELARLYKALGVHYAVGVRFPDGADVWYGLDFDPQGLRFTREPAPPPGANVVHHIAASALKAWFEHRRSIYYVRAYSRRHITFYNATLANGLVDMEHAPLDDLLIHYLTNVAEGWDLAARDLVDYQIAEARATIEAGGQS